MISFSNNGTWRCLDRPKDRVATLPETKCGLLVEESSDVWTVRRCRFISRAGEVEAGMVLSRWATEQQAELAARVALALAFDGHD